MFRNRRMEVADEERTVARVERAVDRGAERSGSGETHRAASRALTRRSRRSSICRRNWFAAPGGFETHPHRGMQTVASLVLDGALHHRDHTGADGVLRAGRCAVDDGGPRRSCTARCRMENETAHTFAVVAQPAGCRENDAGALRRSASRRACRCAACQASSGSRLCRIVGRRRASAWQRHGH